VPNVSVIIPHYNDLSGLDRCLAALVQQTYPAELTEIIVSDNGSPQGIEAVRACIAGRAGLVQSQTRGAGPTRNCGVVASSAPLLAFIDSDCIPEPQWLSGGVAALAGNDVIGGPVNVVVDHDGPLSPAEAYEMVFAFNNKAYIRKKGFTGAGNMFVSRAVFDDVGPFGVGLSEDVDWCHRAGARGYRLRYAPDAAVAHPARRDWAELRSKWLRIQSETYGLRLPTFTNRLRWLARSWAMPFSIAAHIPSIWSSTRLRNHRDRGAALAGLVQLRLWRFLDGQKLAFGLRRN
jgi:GT2 family glycosyltransferase